MNGELMNAYAALILRHIEAEHTEVYPFCDECRQSKGAGLVCPGHGPYAGKAYPPPDLGGDLTDAPIHQA